MESNKGKATTNFMGIPYMLAVDFSVETLQAIREWKDTFKLMKMKELPLILFYPARISFKFSEEIKTFTDKKKLKELITTKPDLQQM